MERKQKKRRAQPPRTPKPRKLPEKPVIGSSSTWREDELDRFNVRRPGDSDVKTLIPDKWFTFERLQEYDAGNTLSRDHYLNCIVRNQLVSVSREELSDNGLVRAKTGHLFAMFRTLQRLEHLKLTDTRKENLAGKRQEKRNSQSYPLSTQMSLKSAVAVGDPAPLIPYEDVEETQRIASISDPTQSSVGKVLFYASQERKTEQLGNDFCDHILGSLFAHDPSLDWVIGRTIPPALQWTSE